MIVMGFACSLMFFIGLLGSIKQGYVGDYDKSHKAEITSTLWLIAALICFK